MTRRVVAALMLLPAATALAGTGPAYALDPMANEEGGGYGSSASYLLTSSTTPGGQGSSANYTARTGFAGQLGAVQGITLSAPLANLAEGQSLQLAAQMLFDDGTSVTLPPGDLAWEITSGPLSAISPTGVATAAIVYQDAPAIVRATHGGFSDDFALTVLNSDPDNYGSYAGDALPDLWQIQYFGLNSPKGGRDDDFDGDRVSNLFEFSNGSDPANNNSGAAPLRISGNHLLSPGTPLVEYLPAPNVSDYRVLYIRRKDTAAARFQYTPQFSRDLLAWPNATTPLTVIADDGSFEVVSVRFPVLIGGRRSSVKAFRLNLNIAAP
ncbi:hypothetical protein [Haloferula sp. BvORR071]|uniref:hypothetical protein n=1 Tax=Haloferula sp. BvORR071 TaxID=1396141 RepID=UPI0005501C26|nr:hypothetical protein [Haloferula sp. BvORR071]